MAALLAAGAGLVTLSAQTDVTAQYFANPSFENGTEGWTLPTAASYTNNGTYKAGDAVPSALGTTSSPSDGDYFFHTRHGWNEKSGVVWNLSTSSSQELPAGKYYLVCDYKAYDMCNSSGYHSQLRLVVSGNDNVEIAGTAEKQLFAYFSDGTNGNNMSSDDPKYVNYIGKADWSKIGVYFELTEAKSIKVGLNARLWSNQRSDMLYDNLRLYTCDEENVTVNAPLDMTGCVPNARMEAGNLVWNGGLALQGNTDRPNHSGFYMLEKWTGSPNKLGNLDANQTLTGLPNGKYRLSAAINATMQNTENPRDISGVSLYAGSQSTAVATDNGVPEIFTVEDVVTDGNLKIGLKTENCTANWIAWDNVTLTYLGFDTTAAIEKLNEQLTEARNMVATEVSLDYLLTDLNTKIANAEAAIQTATKKALETASSELNASMIAYKAAVLPLSQLKEAIARCQEINEKSVATADDKAGLESTIAAAQSVTTSAVNADELNTAIAVLETARQTYVLAAQPINGFVFDVTFKIVNAAVASSDGWSGTRMNAGEQYDGAPDNTYFDIWNATMNMTQAVSGLPEGVYSLKAATRAEANVTVGNIYVESDGETFRTDIHHVGNSGNELGGGWGWTLVDGIKVTSGNIKIGFYAECGNGKWAGADDFHLYYSGIYAMYAPLRAEADALLASGSVMSAACKDALADKELTQESSVEELSDAIAGLRVAIANAKTSIANYAYLQRETATAKSFGIDVTAEEAAIAGGTYDDEAAVAAAQALNVATYNKVKAEYVYDYEVGNWSGEIGKASGQHWSGDGRSYYDTAGTDITRSLTTKVTLPAGEYVLMAAGRSATAATMELKIDDTTVKFTAKGDTGYGIDTDGQANFSEDGTYANNGNGRGWEWEFVHLNLTEETEVELNATITTSGWAWGSFSDIMLKMDKETYKRIYVSNTLNGTIAQAEAATKVNVGEGAFKYSADAVSALQTAIASAQGSVDGAASLEIEELVAANDALKAALEAYKASGLNEPAEGEVFNIIIRTGDNYGFKDIPWAFRENGVSGMFINKSYINRPHLAQYVTFTKVDGTDNYILSTVFADGVERFVSTGAKIGGGNDSQIRLTDDSEKALVVKVIATETEGIYHLLNTAANANLGCQDGDGNAEGGVYTTGAHSDLALVSVEKPAVTLKVTEAGFATVMLPYAVKEIPEGIKVYATESAEESQVAGNKVLTLTEATEIAANTPYIVEGKAGEYTFTGVGAAYNDAYTAGLLTGTFVQTTAVPGTYVLQNNNGIAGFYRVAEGAEPTVGANRAYLTAPADASAEVTAFVFEGVLTGIQGVDAAAAQVDVYTIDGVKVREGVKMSEALNGLSKGIYVVNGAKKAVK